MSVRRRRVSKVSTRPVGEDVSKTDLMNCNTQTY